MKMISLKRCIVTVVLFFLMCSPVAAAVKISSLPQPQPSAKLRVFVVAVTTESKFTKRPVLWPVSPEEFDRKQKHAIHERLKLQGIYEVVNDMDIQAAIGDQTVSSWEWTANDWALAKDVGKALHADYAMVFERSFRVNLQFDTKLINLNTGKQFEAAGYVPSTMLRHMTMEQRKQGGVEVMKIHFRRIFHDAKSDLLQTALRKGKVAGKEPGSSSPAVPPPVKLQLFLIDEKQAVQVGKWLAANEAVTGNLAILGNTSILQVKRVDIKTLSTMALGSLKCPKGREDELLGKMPELARKLVKSAK